MDKHKLEELLEIFAHSDLEEMELQHSFWSGTRIRLSRRRPRAAPSPGGSAPADPSLAAVTPPSPALSAAVPAEDLHTVSAPMVGTFYRASSPEAAPFVQVGDAVEVGQTLCLIEAMKIMNEIEAPVDGEIAEILADNAEPVEYNQPLLRIRPARPG